MGWAHGDEPLDFEEAKIRADEFAKADRLLVAVGRKQDREKDLKQLVRTLNIRVKSDGLMIEMELIEDGSGPCRPYDVLEKVFGLDERDVKNARIRRTEIRYKDFAGLQR